MKTAGKPFSTWLRHQMETFSALLAICAGNSPVPGEFTAQRPVTRSFDVFFDLRLKPLSKQWWGWWFETLSRPLWRHCNERVALIWSLNTGCRYEKHFKTKFREISFAFNVFLNYLFVFFKFCTERGSITVVQSAKFQNDWKLNPFRPSDIYASVN